MAAIDKIAQEEILCIRTLATHLEENLQVVKLPMNVTANLHDKNDHQYRNR